MSDYQERVIAERDGLANMMLNLAEFINSKDFRSKPDDEQALITEQLKLQADYHSCLIKRIKRFTPTEV